MVHMHVHESRSEPGVWPEFNEQHQKYSSGRNGIITLKRLPSHLFSIKLSRGLSFWRVNGGAWVTAIRANRQIKFSPRRHRRSGFGTLAAWWRISGKVRSLKIARARCHLCAFPISGTYNSPPSHHLPVPATYSTGVPLCRIQVYSSITNRHALTTTHNGPPQLGPCSRSRRRWSEREVCSPRPYPEEL